MKSPLTLTPDQLAAVENLKKALAACEKAGVYIWDHDSNLCAVNFAHIREIYHHSYHLKNPTPVEWEAVSIVGHLRLATSGAIWYDLKSS